MALAFVLAAIILAFGPCPASFLASEGAKGVATVGAAASGTGTCSYDAHHEKLWCSLRTLNAQNNTSSIQVRFHNKIVQFFKSSEKRIYRETLEQKVDHNASLLLFFKTH